MVKREQVCPERARVEQARWLFLASSGPTWSLTW